MKIKSIGLFLTLNFSASAQQHLEVSEIFRQNIENGNIQILSESISKIDSNTLEILKKIHSSKIVTNKPILIFDEDRVLINDLEVLNKIFSDSRQTVTSAR